VPTTNSLATVIFSKDRACQLDTLLRSMRDHFSPSDHAVHILFKSTTSRFKEGYERLRSKNFLPHIVWIEESRFKTDVMSLLTTIDDTLPIMFLVDDIVFHKKIQADDMLSLFGNRHLFISLRCSRSYAADIRPKFLHSDNYLEWRWTFRSSPRGAWNYPFSLDGNIFRKRFFAGLCKSLDFKGPNSLEGNLHSARKRISVRWRSKALAPCEAVLFNNPLNKVQTEGETWHKGMSAEELNEKYCSGFCIDNSMLYSAQPDCVHFSADAVMVKENACP
jgi:hypothetical protein